MVARIKNRHSISKAVNYNEKKVDQKKALLLLAKNYPKDPDKLSFTNKLKMLENLAALNKNVKANSVHISLNFDPSEKLSKETLQAIATDYMDKIGFGNQPYLVYEHYDAGHPHLHIVSTNIQANGKRIEMHNIGRNQSEKARKEIEQTYGLVKAEGSNKRKQLGPDPINTQKVIYGKSETKRAITNVLDAVISQFKYTSLPELNAILKQYNVVVDRGKEGGRIYKHNGLLYHVLDEKGNKVGVPIKASSIYSKPTLALLEKKFTDNELKRQPDLKRLMNTIDWTLAQKPGSFREFLSALEKEKVKAVVRQNDKGFIYGLTYIDYSTKSVFNGSDIGKGYSAKAIQERFSQQQTLQVEPADLLEIYHKTFPEEYIPAAGKKTETDGPKEKVSQPAKEITSSKLIEELFMSEDQRDDRPYELKPKKKKKRKKDNH